MMTDPPGLTPDSDPPPDQHLDSAGYVLGNLGPTDLEAFEAHLAECGRCQAEVSEMRPLRDLLIEAIPVKAPAQLHERTIAAITATPSTRSDSDSTAQLRKPPRWTSAPGKTAVRILAAVATIVLIVALGPYLLMFLPVFGGAGGGPEEESTELILVATNGGPQHGTATISGFAPGNYIDLKIKQLPPAPAGSRYTAWMVGPGDALSHPNRVAIGSFTTDGDATETNMMTPASLKQYPVVDVTLEPLDGNPQRRGPQILVSRP
jgi:hypothetical protein